MEVNKKQAPQQDILSIERTGSWGNVEYRHRLVCGHTEVRKRPSSAPKIACALCVIAKEKGVELKALSTAKRPEYVPLPDVHDIIVDETVEAEIYAQKLQGALSSSLGCPPDAIDVVMYIDDDGVVSIQYVQVFLDLHTAKKIARLDIPSNN